MLLFHGLSAYRGERNPLGRVRNANRCIDKEISTATRPIGPIGVVVHGEVTNVFPEDCWSYVGRDGRRYPSSYWEDWDHGLDLSNSIELEKWLKETHQEFSDWDRHYCECFMLAKAITHVWVKPYAGNLIRKTAGVIARKHGAEIIEVEYNTRPWDILPPYDNEWEQYYDLAEELALCA